MDDVKHTLKKFVKKIDSNISSSSGRFKGQGRVLGGSSISSGSANQLRSSNPQLVKQKQESSFSVNSKQKPISSTAGSDRRKPASVDNSPNFKPSNGSDQFDSRITPGKVSQKGFALDVPECPVYQKSYVSEEEVVVHEESCICKYCNDDLIGNGSEDCSRSELEKRVGAYILGKPQLESIEIVQKLLRNVMKDPDNMKYRRIRLGNPKIKPALTEATGGVDLLKFIGFELEKEDGETWAVLPDALVGERICLMKKVIMLLEQKKLDEEVCQEIEEPFKIDRQTRVFLTVRKNSSEKIELPDSFYDLSVDELKKEADSKKKKIAESQLLIPKSYKEKQARAAKKLYARTIVRTQFPDGVILQGTFAPSEPTSALYEFVRKALKDPGLEFELLRPAPVKLLVVPKCDQQQQQQLGERSVSLEDEGMVPTSLVMFKPSETDSLVFMGLSDELLATV